MEWGHDHEQEGLVADTNARAYGIAFRSINEEWTIKQPGAASMAAPVLPWG